MHCALYAALEILFLSVSVGAMDPLEGTVITMNCLQPRKITGCNETLLQAYKRAGKSKGDQNINEADTRFYLFTCEDREHPEFLHKCGGRLSSNTNFNRTRKTIFICPGYISHVCDMAFQREMKDQFLCSLACKYNVILVDWPWGNGVDYAGAASNTKVVGKQIAFVVKNIMEQTGTTTEQFHCIGHSLGAHICGFAGKHLGQWGRITALDVAAVGFQGRDPEDRLHQSDAKRMDVIHTNGGHCFPFTLGFKEPQGHADFYPNGGTKQLSCYIYLLLSFLKQDFYYAAVNLLGPFCPHFQSVQYFKVSINPCGCQFIGVECDSYKSFIGGKCRSCGKDGSKCAVMGMDWDKFPYKAEDNVYRKYYLKTDLVCPYCRPPEKDGIQLEGFPRTPIKGDKRPRCFYPGNNTCC